MVVSFDKAADVYDKTRGLPSSDLIKAIIDEISDAQTVLDAGVGTSRFAKPLLMRGMRVVGVDISGEMLLYAKEKAYENL